MLDFEDYSLTQPAVLVTILAEAILRSSIEKLLKNLKVYGYSVSEVDGVAKRVQRFGTVPSEAAPTEIENYTTVSIEIRAVVSAELSNVILYALKEQQREFAIVVYRQKIEALLE
ncbi:MAG: hypothetical protein EDM05_015580 [Leptolyngbya sp. IPPAS B-1204]|nr:hypothetical protein [Elainella sp. C42_A2020_010]RNJ68065.1 MAG: hypothetical protein EDM05_16560 [Leptolyngbya sp. IPPAS B-1204]